MSWTNQGEAVSRAKYKVSECESGLRDAQNALDRTPRHENRAASVARDDARNALGRAESELRSAEANAR